MTKGKPPYIVCNSNSYCISQDRNVFNRFSQKEVPRDIETLVNNAGYSRPTLFQRQIVPTILEGKDLLVETGQAVGKTGALITPLLLMIEKDAARGIQALLVTSESRDVRKIEGQAKLFRNRNSALPRLIGVGQDKNPRRERKAISEEPDILAGTTDRIIDHLRRGNLDLGTCSYFFVYRTKYHNTESFDKDVLYINSKLGKKAQTVVFLPVLEDNEYPYSEILKRPLTVKEPHWNPSTVKHVCYESHDRQRKQLLLQDLFSAMDLTNTLVVCKNGAMAELLEKQLTERGICPSISLSPSAVKTLAERLRNQELRAVILTQRQVSDILFPGGVCNIIFFSPPSAVDYRSGIRALEESEEDSSIITLYTHNEAAQMKKLEEETKVAMKKEDYPDQEEVLKGTAQQILRHIKEEEDPEELNQLRKMFKRHVPITMRGYVGAYLLKQFAQGNKHLKKQTGKTGSPGKSAKTSDETSGMKTLFVSVGKNRKVFPRDLARLFSMSLNIDQSKIGNIKILDSYSFIEIPEDLCAKAIEQLNDKEYRGKKITVNNARKKSG